MPVQLTRLPDWNSAARQEPLDLAEISDELLQEVHDARDVYAAEASQLKVKFGLCIVQPGQPASVQIYLVLPIHFTVVSAVGMAPSRQQSECGCIISFMHGLMHLRCLDTQEASVQCIVKVRPDG